MNTIPDTAWTAAITGYGLKGQDLASIVKNEKWLLVFLRHFG